MNAALLSVTCASCASNYSSFSVPTPVVSRSGEFDASGFLEPSGLDLHADYCPIAPVFIGATGTMGEGWALSGEARLGAISSIPISDDASVIVAGWADYGQGRIHQTTNLGEMHMGGPEVLEVGNTRRRSIAVMGRLQEHGGFHVALVARLSHFDLLNGRRTFLDDSANYPGPEDISGSADFLEKYFVVGFPVDRHATFDLQLCLPTLLGREPKFGWNEIMIGAGLQYRFSH